MTTVSTRRLDLITLLGFFCFLVTLTVQLLWIHAFHQGASQPERVHIFLAYFPEFLGLRGITVMEIILCVVAIVISIKSYSRSWILWKLLRVIVIIGCALLLLLTLFGLL
jgi:hypothetical protein